MGTLIDMWASGVLQGFIYHCNVEQLLNQQHPNTM